MKKLYILVIMIFLLLYILPLGVRPIVDPDESRYGQIAREMLDSGDFIVPRLNGLRYFEKPVLGHWMNAASIAVFGKNAFAIRFPSSLATGLTALLIFFMAGSFTGGGVAGIIAAMIYLTCFEVFSLGVFSVLDPMFTFFITAAVVLFFYGYSSPDDSTKKAAFWIDCGIFTGFAFLTKGFIAFAILIAVIVPFLIWEKKWKVTVPVLWKLLAVSVLVILPWAVLIHLKEPDFWHYFFWEEHIRRFAGEYAQHKESFFYYLFLFPLAAVPWIFLFPAAVRGIYNKLSDQPVIKFMICWFVSPFLFFSLSKGKMLTYILPCFVPFALLVAIGLLNIPDKKSMTRFKNGGLMAAAFFGILAMVLTLLQMTDFFHVKPYLLAWKHGLVFFSLISCVFLFLVSVYTDERLKKIVVYALAPAMFLFVAHFSLPDSMRANKTPGIFLSEQAEKIKPGMIVVSSYRPIRAVNWFFNRNDIYLLESSGELTYGIQYPDSVWRMLTIDSFSKLIARHAGHVVLVATIDEFSRWKSRLPNPQFFNQNGKYVFSIF